MTDRMVLYGGTFDPVHYGHLITARAVAEERGYDKVVLLPAASPPHKAPASAGGAERLQMLRLAVADDPMFDVCDMELRRTGKSYTFDTLDALSKSSGGGEIHWIIGADMLADLPNWHRASEVVDLATIVVALRPPWHERIGQALDDLSARMGPEQAEKIASGVVTTPLIDISSTDIRRRVALGLPIRYLVCDSVANFIREKGLYGC